MTSFPKINASIEAPMLPSQTDSNECLGASKTAVLAKFIFATITVLALGVATFFSAGTVLGMIGAGAAFWKISLMTAVAVTAFFSFIGSLYFGPKNQMFEDTKDNLADCKNYLIDIFSTPTSLAHNMKRVISGKTPN